MCKVQIMGLRREIKNFVETLHEEGIVQLKEFSEQHVQKEFAQEHFSQISQELLKLKSVQKILPQTQIKKSREPVDYKKALQIAKNLGIAEKVSKLQEKKEFLLAKRQSVLEKEKQIVFFKKFDMDFSALFNSECLDVLAAKMNAQNFLAFERHLKEQGVFFEVLQKEIDKENVLAIVAFEREQVETVKLAFDKSGATIEQLPQISSSPQIALKKIKQEIDLVNQELAQIEKEFLGLSDNYLPEMVFLIECLSIENERAQATQLFGRTDDVFVMEAYLPERDFERLKSAIENKFPKRVFIEKFSMHDLHHEAEEVPTLLENPSKLGPFEFMTKFVSIPQSFEIDPTLIFAIVFPLVYGMMLGDVGYGFLSLVFALLIRRYASVDGILYPIASIWAIAAFPSIFFGIIFDEYFGFSHVHLLEKFGVHIEPLYHGLERLHNIPEVLILTIATGFVVICLGFFLGFVKEWREGKKAHAIAKLAWITLLVFGTTALLGFVMGGGATLVAVGAVGFVISLGLIVKNEGFVALIEIPSVAGNILSFARILAVGLASVVVAVTINDLAFPSPEKGLLLVVLIPIFLFGHAFNTFLGMFESLIQGARLNYVEFFSKFFSGGGREFSPFKVERKFSKRR